MAGETRNITGGAEALLPVELLAEGDLLRGLRIVGRDRYRRQSEKRVLGRIAAEDGDGAEEPHSEEQGEKGFSHVTPP